MKYNWVNEIYVKHAKIYQPILEKGLATAPLEVVGLHRIFRRYGTIRSKTI